jgi:hypothetical protein
MATPKKYSEYSPVNWGVELGCRDYCDFIILKCLKLGEHRLRKLGGTYKIHEYPLVNVYIAMENHHF